MGIFFCWGKSQSGKMSRIKMPIIFDFLSLDSVAVLQKEIVQKVVFKLNVHHSKKVKICILLQKDLVMT